MLTIYDSKESKDNILNTNGIGVIETIESYIEETINDDYILTFKVAANNKRSDLLVKYNIVRDENYNGFQVFRITKVRKQFDYIECICKHITYDLDKNFINDMHLSSMQGDAAFNKLISGLTDKHVFTNSSNLTNTATLYMVRKTFNEAFYGDKDTFLSTWGGEVERNNFNIGVVIKRGEDRGFYINEGKNIIDIEESIEGEEVTRIIPVGRKTVNGTEVPHLLPTTYVDSPLINNYPFPSYGLLDLPDVKIDDTTTEELINIILRKMVEKQYNDLRVDRPKINFKVNFIETSKLNDYKEKSILNQLYIGDTCTVYSNKLKIDVKTRLIKYKWDCNAKKYVELELGDYSKAQASTVAKLEDKVIKKTGKDIDYLKTAQAAATEFMNNALGGYVVKRDGELLIMDTPDIATATKVWRWNSSGLGYSSTGYHGTYGTAITMDGHIVANYVDTGQLSANIIKTGTITSTNGAITLSIDKDNLIIQHTGSETYTTLDNEGLAVHKAGGEMVASYRETANVPEQHSTMIYTQDLQCPTVGRRIYATATIYVSPGGSGDRSGKDENNCCQTIQEALRILLNGANHYNGTAGIVVKNGTYSNADYDVRIEDLHGIGELQIKFETDVTYRGRIIVDTCTKYINIFSTAKTPLNTRGGMIFPTGPAPCIDVIASHVKVSGLMLHVNETDHDESTGVRASRGALVEVGDCDIYVVRAAFTAYGVGTKIWAYDNRGSTMHYIGIILDTAHIDFGWRVPRNNHENAPDEAHVDRFGTYTMHDIQTRQDSLNIQASGGSSKEISATFSPTRVYSSRNYTEENIFYQAAWTEASQFGYWRGTAEFGNQISSFCNGASNIKITFSFNAQGGVYGYSGQRSVYIVTGDSGANSTFIGHCDRGGAFTSSEITSGPVFEHIKNGGAFMIFSTSMNDYLKVDTGTIRAHLTATKTV